MFLAQSPDSQSEQHQPVESADPEAKSAETTDADQTADETTPNQQQETNGSQSAGPYDMETIKAFNRALYGS